MTLFRQLFVATLLCLFILFAGIWFEKLQSTRSFLIDQLESHTQDVATSLALSLSRIMADGDIPTAETMINAVFDRGYYRSISLRDIDNKVVVERGLDVRIAGVPDWFVNLISIDSPSVESLVMAGWNQAGKIYVESHPGYAYQTMWSTMIRMCSYFGFVGIGVLVLGGLALRMLLKPLKRVELQAEAICRKEYQIQENLPNTRELRQVVESMNRMTAQVRDMFSQQAKVAERLRRQAYSDQLTGLGNRRYMTAQVEARLDAAKGSARGALLMLQVDNLQEINEMRGFAAGDDLLKKIATILQLETKMLNDVTLARLTGGDFTVFIPQISSAEAYEVTENLNTQINRLASQKFSHSDNLAHIGGVVYSHIPTLSLLLSEADNALQAARLKGPNQYQMVSISADEDNVAKGKLWWKATLESVLEKGDIILYGQPVMSSGDRGEMLHQEVLSRIALDSGEIVSAGIFIPLAERLQLVSKLDRVVLKKVFMQKETMAKYKTVAVNVSPSSLKDSAFVNWLMAELPRLPESFPHIIFEFPEFGAVQSREMLKDFSNRVQQCGHAIGLDHFGQSFSNFGYLKSLRPEYVKIDRTFTRDLEHEPGDSEFFIGALSGVAHSLDIQVIAEGVEREDQVEKLLDLNIDALQGYLFGKPQEL